MQTITRTIVVINGAIGEEHRAFLLRLNYEEDCLLSQAVLL